MANRRLIWYCTCWPVILAFSSSSGGAEPAANTPGELAKISTKFGEEGININYVYGSASSSDEKYLFVFCPEDIELAAKIFQ